MTYKTILVNLNAVERADVLISVGVALARKHQAHLIGLFVQPAVNVFPMTGAVELPTEVLEMQGRQYEKLAENIEAKFQAATGSEDFSAEWRFEKSIGTQIGSKVVSHAMMADLIVACQGDRFGSADGQAELAERLLMETGRPVLVIPRVGEYEQVGEYVLVSWNASQQSARSAFDALPILQQAQSVKLCWIDPDNAFNRDGEIAGSEMATSLARHDVKVEATHTLSNGMSVGETLLQQTKDQGSDLLVMGAYGHSRFKEYVFGGVTRYILEKMTIPVLMSH